MSTALLRDKLRPYRGALALCLALMAAESAAVLLMPWLGGRIAGGLFSAHEVPLGALAAALIGVLALQALLQIIQRRVLQVTAENLSAGLRTDLYDHIQRLPLPWLDDRRRGDLIALVTREVDMLSEFVTGALLGVLPKLLLLAGAIVLMLRIDPILTAPVILGAPAFFVLLKLMGRNIRPLAGEIRDAYAQSVSIADENLSVLQAIKAYTREDLEARRYAASVRRHRDLMRRMIARQSLLGPVVQFAAAASVVLVLWLAGVRAAEDAMAPDELVSFLLYAALLTRPVAGLADLWGQLQHARGALRHMSEVLAVPAEPAQGRQPSSGAKGDIRFEDVKFSYPGRPPLLTGVSLEIAAGETVAITGENGAGKTTLMDLLMRFRRPDEGRILLDGEDISSLDLSAYRQTIALVPQRAALIDGTIGDNIRFGAPDATREQLETAAREAEAWGFIAALPQGLDTVIGERGVRLSGGQRQRVALARALLKKPAILILDEPTAMFDPQGEARFVATARAALAGRTVFLITHRPASLVLADRVLELDGGAIADQIEDRRVFAVRGA